MESYKNPDRRQAISAAAPVPGPERWYVLALLTGVYAVSIADRFSIATLIEPIRLELQLSDSGIAFLTGVALALFYVTVGIPVALLADRTNRRNILVIALALWSAMTALCGVAQNYWQLLLARFGVGIGEAGGTPPSTSILADQFPPHRRPMALTIFALGACLGAWLGSSVAGGVAQSHGWRAAFLVLGIPGVLLALVVWATVAEPKRGRLDGPAESLPPSGLAATARYVIRHRSAFHLVAGGAVATFWSWGLMWWIPTFLVRSHHLTVGEAGELLGPMHLFAGTAATLFASWLMGLPAAADSRFITRLLAWVTAATTVPSIALLCTHSESATRALLWIFVPSVYFYIGPILGLLQNVVPPQMRATTCAILLFAANFANLVIAPQLVGLCSDWFATAFGAGVESLRYALILLAPTGFWAAWHLKAATQTLSQDERAARGPEDGT
ncbi:MAG TPA: MFS transporter [Steroidobacteraceae bacterium]|nr:MFS transporter [Steroidobacteraceae bacterium]